MRACLASGRGKGRDGTGGLADDSTGGNKATRAAWPGVLQQRKGAPGRWRRFECGEGVTISCLVQPLAVGFAC